MADEKPVVEPEQPVNGTDLGTQAEIGVGPSPAELHAAAEKQKARRQERIQKIVAATTFLVERAGPPNAIMLQQGLLAILGELEAMWMAMIGRGLITNDDKQDLLDWGVQEIFNRSASQAREIIRPQ